jgi:hypothetical protein
MPNKKKSAKTRRHPSVTKAIAHIEQLQKGHKKMALDLKKAKATLVKTPFMPFRGTC